MTSALLPPIIVLAGGLGTRLGDIVKATPKAMVQLAGAPFIEHQMKLLKRKGANRVVMSVSHMAEQIEEFVGDGNQYGLSVQYCHDGTVPLGTGGAVKKALPLVGDEFAILYGDTLLDIDYQSAYRTFKSSGASGLMTVLENSNQWDKSNILFKNGRIEVYDKKNTTPGMNHIDYGLIFLRRSSIADYASDRIFDLSEVFQSLISAGDMAGYEVHNRFYEIGTPAALAETEKYLMSDKSR